MRKILWSWHNFNIVWKSWSKIIWMPEERIWSLWSFWLPSSIWFWIMIFWYGNFIKITSFTLQIQTTWSQITIFFKYSILRVKRSYSFAEVQLSVLGLIWNRILTIFWQIQWLIFNNQHSTWITRPIKVLQFFSTNLGFHSNLHWKKKLCISNW